MMIRHNQRIAIEQSEPISITPGNGYSVKAQVSARKGKPYSAYFAVIVLDKGSKEIKRFIRWIDDMTGKNKEYTIVFKAPDNSCFAHIAFRSNHETPLQSDILVRIPPIELIELIPTSGVNELYDDINDYLLPKLPPLSSKDKGKLEQKMVWIMGFGRSGTTWLAERLLQHPDNILWFEPKIGHTFDNYNPKYDPSTKISFMERQLDVLNEPKYFLAPQHKNNWLPQIKDLILSRTYSHARTTSHNIIIKEVGLEGTDLVMECFPRSKFIFLIRDGRDCIESLTAKHVEGSWSELMPFSDPSERYDFVKCEAEQWVRGMSFTQKAYERHAPSLRLLVKYEDLRDSTFNYLKRIYSLIGLEMSEAKISAVVNKYAFKNIPESEKGPTKFNRSASTGGWRNIFSKKEIDLVNSIMGKTLEKFGYKV